MGHFPQCKPDRFSKAEVARPSMPIPPIRNSTNSRASVVAWLLIGLTWPSVMMGQSTAPSFNRDIRPLLSDRCFPCHGPDEDSRATDLRLDQRESAFSDLGGYQAIVKGDPDASELFMRITTEDADQRMPPEALHKPLSEAQIETLRRWIESGAPWDDFWAYVPPERHSVPDVADAAWPVNWIDRFVLASIEAQGMSPAPPADPIVLVRRLYFDLVGLPPPTDVVHRFIQDPSQAAYERLVDQLLASPHFGERTAIDWLDLVRYADTVGYHGDQDHNISPYRDWVIAAFNRNMPFDRFTIEQLAGDLLPDPTTDQRVASGYNRLLQTTHEGGLQPGEYRVIYAADRVRNVSAVWMGATLGCAQCHDHKYDPYTMRDFYSMAAFFADIDDESHFKSGTNTIPTRRQPELLLLDDASQKEREQVRRRLNAARDRLKRLEAETKQDAPPTTSDGTEKNESGVTTLTELRQTIKTLGQQVRQIESRGRWTMITRSLAQPRETRILPRGNWMDTSGPIVQPAIPQFLGRLPTEGRATRLDLARWLVDGSGVGGRLTARVMANRIWARFLGRGIAPSVDDLGGQGQPPTHPELLDNLAVAWIEHDWDLKYLIRLIVTSQTYRQSSVVEPAKRKTDPQNRWFARQDRFRLPAELVRDNALSIAGLLRLEPIGGPSIKPYQPAGYYQHLNFPPRTYHADTDQRQWRRGVYVHWQRQFLHPSYRALDAPRREECTARRPRSNTPLAALALLNDPSFVEAARMFAANILQQDLSEEERFTFAFERATSRPPTAKEIQLLRSLWEQSLSDFRARPDAARQVTQVGLAQATGTLDPIEWAAWTEVARALLNLDETISRN